MAQTSISDCADALSSQYETVNYNNTIPLTTYTNLHELKIDNVIGSNCIGMSAALINGGLTNFCLYPAYKYTSSQPTHRHGLVNHVVVGSKQDNNFIMLETSSDTSEPFVITFDETNMGDQQKRSLACDGSVITFKGTLGTKPITWCVCDTNIKLEGNSLKTILEEIKWSDSRIVQKRNKKGERVFQLTLKQDGKHTYGVHEKDKWKNKTFEVNDTNRNFAEKMLGIDDAQKKKQFWGNIDKLLEEWSDINSMISGLTLQNFYDTAQNINNKMLCDKLVSFAKENLSNLDQNRFSSLPSKLVSLINNTISN
ncbi:predicted protein [Naegleria gruberi]|uniref:Predicted protein n=1 Tax=Naegleria gruberi TaxID=5762 RepID=D2W4M8_NAEGR|nr:uncharacterized protein NAEGRDRAFT_54642 [Naegleria gruberi]EFC35972.1 predicted protein [Naegleria gruberi]|eukprot:XP_002668716.1 predicted protein [Naegleria gruberi strain NEG-M]